MTRSQPTVMETWTIREVNWLERRKLPERQAAGVSTHPGALEKRREALAFLNESSHLSRGMIKKTTVFGAHSTKLALVQAPQRLLGKGAGEDGSKTVWALLTSTWRALPHAESLNLLISPVTEALLSPFHRGGN